ncbi:type II toxin-antitoxin system PemK/MazF family toxin [Acinetobacter pittii]|uniref:type II toxin-antitoxin system PemK/MazF family toxin n=1 Tax=Acinetobacter pittii TaxID=48296 RepID=UPI00190262FC|nr:type II toxin-antitoxin system PemK/MazF family toxin [Acinetobacter pittii]MBJ8481041.1 type II toxin-antitoxin system PemK/MazF family toxin [Acinetobacter pittii]
MTSSSYSINISYFEKTISESNLLGKEVYTGICEAFLPDLFNQPQTFMVKKFENRQNYNWVVKNIIQHENNNELFFDILIEANIAKIPEVYLHDTLKRERWKPTRILYFGTLVEVEFGATQSIVKDKTIKKTKRYPNVLQKNEMRKRRLAIVVKVLSDHRVQVVPITSLDPGSDLSTFQLSRETLDSLVFYGNSGKDSWALCNMLQTVSITRILPPISKQVERKTNKDLSPYVRHIRNELYKHKLSANDRTILSNSLLKTYCSDDYLDLKETKRKYIELLRQIEADRLVEEAEKKELEKYKKVCELYELDPAKELESLQVQ